LSSFDGLTVNGGEPSTQDADGPKTVGTSSLRGDDGRPTVIGVATTLDWAKLQNVTPAVVSTASPVNEVGMPTPDTGLRTLAAA
jgi:hypothetical protein